MKMKESTLKYDCVPTLPKELIDEINIGIADMENGRLISHKESMRQIREELGFVKV